MFFASPCSRSGMRLRAPRDGLKQPRTAPRQPQYSPRRSQDGPRSAQDSPKTAQDGSQTVSRRPKSAPRSLRDGLRGSPEWAGGACTGTDLKLYLLPRLHSLCPQLELERILNSTSYFYSPVHILTLLSGISLCCEGTVAGFAEGRWIDPPAPSVGPPGCEEPLLSLPLIYPPLLPPPLTPKK